MIGMGKSQGAPSRVIVSNIRVPGGINRDGVAVRIGRTRQSLYGLNRPAARLSNRIFDRRTGVVYVRHVRVSLTVDCHAERIPHQLRVVLRTVEKIDGYPGFPEGVPGYDLCPMLQDQAAAAGAEFMITGLERL